MSWATDALAAVRRIVLLEDRINTLTDQSKKLLDTCTDLDRRLVRLEAKFELLERMATSRGRALREKKEL
jgi:predicted  nucleic acid-binding Zn-ribbon protein